VVTFFTEHDFELSVQLESNTLQDTNLEPLDCFEGIEEISEECDEKECDEKEKTGC
jgi:hypothetical protein